MRNKVYVIISIALLFLVVGTTLALTVFRSESIGVNISSTADLGEYINYSSSNTTIGGDNTLNPGLDYTSGLSTTIEFWKKEEAKNWDVYGHIYLDINSGSDELLSSPALKWAVVSNDVLISEGDFDGYVSGNGVPVLLNHKLLNTLTYFSVYVWLDENESMNNLTEGDVFSVSVRCEATLDEYLRFGVNEFDYTGDIQTINLNKGTYMLEVWGAQGGNATYKTLYNGGYGGYSAGTIELTESNNLYIVVGGKGQSVNSSTPDDGIGYNGGGYANYASGDSNHGGGGGATHIALETGLLSSLSESRDNILLVAGGGGGASSHNSTPSYSGTGGHAGGYIGSSGVTANTTCYNYGTGGSQELAGTYTLCTSSGRDGTLGESGFGFGINYSSFTTGVSYAGGGAGFYGGGSGNHGPGGGGSGYIGNPLLTNKVMYCYQCMEDSNENTYTISTNEVNDSPISNSAKIGNGYVIIKDINKYTEVLSRKVITAGTDYDFKANIISELPEGYTVTYSTYNNANNLSAGEYQIRYLVEDSNNNILKYCQKIEVIGG